MRLLALKTREFGSCLGWGRDSDRFMLNDYRVAASECIVPLWEPCLLHICRWLFMHGHISEKATHIKLSGEGIEIGKSIL